MPMQMEEARAYVMQALRRGRCAQLEDVMIAVGNLKPKPAAATQRPTSVVDLRYFRCPRFPRGG
jgi:hypothetical protein